MEEIVLGRAETAGNNKNQPKYLDPHIKIRFSQGKQLLEKTGDVKLCCPALDLFTVCILFHPQSEYLLLSEIHGDNSALSKLQINFMESNVSARIIDFEVSFLFIFHICQQHYTMRNLITFFDFQVIEVYEKSNQWY